MIPGLGSLMTAVGGGARPNPMNWTAVVGVSPRTTNTQTVTGITTDITLHASRTGGASVAWIKNGANVGLITGGDLSVSLDDTVAFQVTGNTSGDVTVTNVSDGNALIDTFAYSVTS